jgi:hypothetical protein
MVQLCEILEHCAYSISQTSVKELKQKKNMNVEPNRLNNEFQIQACWMGKDFSFLSWSFDLIRKIVLSVWGPRKANHEDQHFSIIDLDIFQSHNGLQCEIFDNGGKGGLKVHPNHIKNHDRFLKMATL